MKINRFYVERSKWARGNWFAETGRDAELLDKNGSMCCLGFLGRACNIPKERLQGQGAPDIIDEDHIDKWPPYLLRERKCPAFPTHQENSGVTNHIIKINDDNGISDKVREYKLRRKFKSLGVEIIFID